MIHRARVASALAFLLASCGGGASGSPSAQRPASQAPAPAPTPTRHVAASCTSATAPPSPRPGPAAQPAGGLTVPSGLHIEIIAKVPGGPRELVSAPNGDLFVGTHGSSVYVIQNAEGQAATPHVFATLPDSLASGVALSMKNCSLYVGTEFGVYRVPYTVAAATGGTPVKVASVRSAGASDHNTTSVAVSGSTLYASIGSSCNACTETDPTRATIQQMNLDGSAMVPRAVHIRNAIALTVNPSSGAIWAGDAGQDGLPAGHPYEFFDDVSAHNGVANYGWPSCEENHVAYIRGANCSAEVVPRVAFPAYETPIGAAFYEPAAGAPNALPAQYRGGAFVAMHGSWHTNSSGVPVTPPRVLFVPMSGDTPKTAVDWSTPTKQWNAFVTGFQRSDGSRIGRPTGVATGPHGSLFIGDDQTDSVYRVRP